MYKRQVEGGQAGGGVVGDPAEVIADGLAGHNLHVPRLLDADIGKMCIRDRSIIT